MTRHDRHEAVACLVAALGRITAGGHVRGGVTVSVGSVGSEVTR